MQKADIVDDGTWGTPGTSTNVDGAPPHPPSAYMYSGKFGLYTEDAEVEYSPLIFNTLEVSRQDIKTRANSANCNDIRCISQNII